MAPIVALLLSLLLLPAASRGGQQEGNALPWHGREEAIENVLLHGKVVHKERIGRGITRPFKVLVEHDGERLYAIWKPLGPCLPGSIERYQAEVVAYRLSRYLGLDMVPPTVERRIGQQLGSLQMWVDGFSMYADLVDPKPPPLVWSHQMARMRFFDELIENPDRNAGNFLVDDSWRVVLIDHSQALAFDRPVETGDKPLSMFDRHLVDRVRELDSKTLDEVVGDVLPRSDRSQILYQRDVLLGRVDQIQAELGDGVFFGAEP